MIIMLETEFLEIAGDGLLLVTADGEVVVIYKDTSKAIIDNVLTTGPTVLKAATYVRKSTYDVDSGTSSLSLAPVTLETLTNTKLWAMLVDSFLVGEVTLSTDRDTVNSTLTAAMDNISDTATITMDGLHWYNKINNESDALKEYVGKKFYTDPSLSGTTLTTAGLDIFATAEPQA